LHSTVKARYGDIKSDDIPGESTDSESEDEDAEVKSYQFAFFVFLLI